MLLAICELHVLPDTSSDTEDKETTAAFTPANGFGAALLTLCKSGLANSVTAQ